jgi:hypothetical protein
MNAAQGALRATLVTLVLAAACGAAAAQIVPITWDAAQRFQLTSTVRAGKIVEVCGRLPRGALVHWSFRSEAPLDFNIHYHEGAKVVMPEQRDRTSAATGTLLAPLAQSYCWMWTQRGSSDAPLTLTLQRTRR